MDTKKDKKREGLMLCLLAVSPVLIGYLFNVMLYIPVIGSLGMYAAPFTVLYFWGWVGTVFQGKFNSIWKSVLTGNAAGILSFIVFIVLCQRGTEGEMSYILSALSQMFTLPLGFLTMWIAVMKEGVYDLNEASVSAVILTQAAGLILMLAAFTVGCFIARKKEA